MSIKKLYENVVKSGSGQRARVDVFKKVVPREFTCNIILDYERDKLHSFDSNSFSK